MHIPLLTTLLSTLLLTTTANQIPLTLRTQTIPFIDPSPSQLTLPAPETTPTASQRAVVCYMTEWNILNMDYASYPADKCTHIFFAFARIVGNNIQLSSSDGNGVGLFPVIKKLKVKNPAVKICLSVGGWGLSSAFRQVATDKSFAINVNKFVLQHGLDGIDIDFEYPVGGGEDHKTVPENPKEKQDFVTLLSNLRASLGPQKIISIAVAGKKADIIRSYNIKAIVPLVDYIGVMSYDLMNRRDPVALHHASVRGVVAVMNFFKKLGAPASKLLLGLPFYGKTFPTISKDCPAIPPLDNPVASKCKVPVSKLEGPRGEDLTAQNYPQLANKGLFFLLYGQWGVLDQITSPEQFDRRAGAYYKYWKLNSQENAYITYDKLNTIAAKLKYAKVNATGVMYWAGNLDTKNFDFTRYIAKGMGVKGSVAVNGVGELEVEEIREMEMMDVVGQEVLDGIEGWEEEELDVDVEVAQTTKVFKNQQHTFEV